tara:strand:+ start:2563 stop:6816 length:4254 start_codon:yes stop_codon:yes gene_type:complete
MINNGDLIINKQAQNNEMLVASEKKFSNEELENRKNFLYSTESSKFKEPPTNIKSIIALDQDNKGNVKYTFDNIYENKDLARVAQDYYGNKNDRSYTEREAIDKFISDRIWKQSNTFSIGKEFKYITGTNVGEDQKARLAYLTREWNALPNFYQEGGMGLEGLARNIGVALVDPLNIFGGIVGGLAGKAVVKKAAGKAVQKATEKKIKKDILSDPETLASLSSKVKSSQLLTTAGTIGAIDTVGFAAADIAAQTTEKELGLRERLDPARTALVSIGAFGTSFLTTGGIGGGIRAFRNTSLEKEATNLSPLIKKGEKLTDEALRTKEGIAKSGFLRRQLADQYDFVKVLQKNILGVEGSAAGLKAAIKSKKFDIDPVLMPYFQLRMAAASSTRAHEFIKKGFYMPPSNASGKSSYIKGNSKGLNELLKPFDDVAEVNSFLYYAMAKRQQFILKAKPGLKEDLPLTIKEMREALDYGELTPAQYQAKYNKKLKRKLNVENYQKGLEDLKIFTDEALDYSVSKNLLSPEDAVRIKKVNPYFVPFTRKTKGITKRIIGGIDEQTDTIIRTARPGAKKLAEKRLEGEINLYDNLVDYVYKTVNGGDRNAAKLALYDMIEQGKKLGQLDKDAVVRKVNPITYKKAIGASIEKKYAEAGFKIANPDKKTLPNLDVAVFSGTLKTKIKETGQDGLIDIVYRNGKQEAYEIRSPELQEAFVSFGSRTPNAFDGQGTSPGRFFFKALNWTSRFSSRAITYSPPFVAFNIIRDTLAGTVNSLFGIVNKEGVGFVPGWTTVGGLINSYKQNDAYRKGLINGLGYSNRAESEAILGKSTEEILKYGVGREAKLYTGSLKYMKNKFAAGWRGYTDFVSRVEYATRLGEYNLAKASGFSDEAAAFLGREVATDFGMKGSSRALNVFSRNTMFLNASIQGLYRTGRLAFEGNALDKARVAATIGTTIVLPEIYLYYANRNIEQYKQLDERIKQLNYVIPIFDDRGNWERFIYIPKPYDLGFFANTGVALVKGIEENSGGLGTKYFLSSLSNILPGAPIPQALRPAAELYFNKNFYTGSPVLGYYEQPLIESLQARPKTRKIAIATANFLSNIRGPKLDLTGDDPEGRQRDGFSPVKIDYLLGAYATGLLQYPIDILNTIAFETADLPVKETSLVDVLRGPDPGTRKPGDRGFKDQRTRSDIWFDLANTKINKLQKFLNEKDIVNKKGFNIAKPAADIDQADMVRRPWSIVTRRFTSSKTIKQSAYHQEWYRIGQRAKELGVLNLADLNIAKLSNSKLISVFDRIKTNIDNNEPLMSKEVYVYTEWLGGTFNEVLKLMGDYREFRKGIELQPNLDSKTKRIRINELYAAENILLKQYLDLVASIEIDGKPIPYVFESKLEKEFPAVPGFLKPRLPTRKRGQKEKKELTIEDFKF